MLEINRKQYNDVDDARLRDAFGYSFWWTGTFYNYLLNKIRDNTVFRYPSKRNLIDSYLLWVSARFLTGPLRLNQQVLEPNHAQAYPIVMTGSRSDDLKGLPQAPPNYTWHHAENIWYKKGHLYCNMFLVDSAYHSRQHCGGVNEYKWIYTTGYR